MAARYRALVGIDYPGGRVEVGEVTDAIPAKSARWLLDQNLIEPADTKPPKAPRDAGASDPDPGTTPVENAPQDAATGPVEGSE